MKSPSRSATPSPSKPNHIFLDLLTLNVRFDRHISAYLDRPEVRKQIGVDKSIKSNFSSVSWEVNSAFSLSMDEFRPTYLYVAALLERGVKALIYVGANDWICNHVGNEQWTLNLEWSGQQNFSSQPLRDWFVDGKRAGQTRRSGGLTFATIDGAGHMVRNIVIVVLGLALIGFIIGAL